MVAVPRLEGLGAPISERLVLAHGGFGQSLVILLGDSESLVERRHGSQRVCKCSIERRHLVRQAKRRKQRRLGGNRLHQRLHYANQSRNRLSWGHC